MIHLKQSTSVDIGIGPFLDDTDGKTAETALTITQPDIRLKKNGGAWAQKNAAQTLSHEENGWYELTLDATDTNTLGIPLVAIHESGALPVWVECMVLPANVYDSLFGSDKLDVNVEEWNATSVPAEHTAGYPVVTVKDGSGTGEIDTASGVVKTSLDVAGSEPTGVPSPTDTPVVQLQRLHMALRNQVTVSATKKTFYDDAGNAEWEQDLSDDGTVYTQSEANAI